jgi:nitrile hydratase subunit beta
MDGIHDMGGMDGFGKVEAEPNEPVFHAAWEGRCLALNRAMGFTGIWTIDETRAGIEELPPDIYLTSSYYKKWALRLENLVVERGLAGADEVKAGHALRPGQSLKRKLNAVDVPNTLTRGSYGRPSRSAIACVPRTFTRRRIRACRAMHAAAPAWLRRCAAVTSIPTRSPSATARIRNGSTQCCSRAANCGAMTPIRR